MAIRQQFKDYFKGKAHQVVESAPLVPEADPTLLFTNAGMVPFKDYFTATQPAPFKKAVSVQKCIRAGGKHNDLEEVGKTAIHHTFFEMLGNFSFGECSKEEAINLAWEFLTVNLKLRKDCLYPTVHKQDAESHKLWSKVTDPASIVKKGDADNFWSMAKVGPCGHCTEIFYKQGKFDGEIWNLVFMEYQTDATGKRLPLKAKGVDTGMGLERITAVCEQVFDNYQTSIFTPLITAASRLMPDASPLVLRVVADHIRAAAFLLAEGVQPNNEGRGYVLRRIIRRAVRHCWQSGAKKPILGSLVPTLVSQMGEVHPILKSQPIAEMLADEEAGFLATIAKGMALLGGHLNQKTLRGEVAFKLYDTYGFPLDLTADILKENKITLDKKGFDRLMAQQKERGKKAWKGDLPPLPPTEFCGYQTLGANSKIIALLDENYQPIANPFAHNPNEAKEIANGTAKGKGKAEGENNAEASKAGSKVCWIAVEKTPFYATSGGQQADEGTIVASTQATKATESDPSKVANPKGGLRVADVVKVGKGTFLHKIELSEPNTNFKGFEVGKEVSLKVDPARRSELAKHHSATHLLHAALRQLLGSHVEQRGSLVAADRLRFDISHPKPMSPEQIEQTERLVTQQVCANTKVTTQITDYETAIKGGAMALFGEKYGNQVRVVSMGEFSVELCGGTHVDALGQIGGFAITSQSAVGSGIRRLEAVCGAKALAHWQNLRSKLHQTAAALKTSPNNLPDAVAGKGTSKGTKAGNKTNPPPSSPPKLTMEEGLGWAEVQGGDIRLLRSFADKLKPQAPLVALFAPEGEKLAFVIATQNADAVAAAKLVARKLGGSGGGKPHLAAGGGKGKVADGVKVLREFTKCS